MQSITLMFELEINHNFFNCFYNRLMSPWYQILACYSKKLDAPRIEDENGKNQNRKISNLQEFEKFSPTDTSGLKLKQASLLNSGSSKTKKISQEVFEDKMCIYFFLVIVGDGQFRIIYYSRIF